PFPFLIRHDRCRGFRNRFWTLAAAVMAHQTRSVLGGGEGFWCRWRRGLKSPSYIVPLPGRRGLKTPPYIAWPPHIPWLRRRRGLKTPPYITPFSGASILLTPQELFVVAWVEKRIGAADADHL